MRSHEELRRQNIASELAAKRSGETVRVCRSAEFFVGTRSPLPLAKTRTTLLEKILEGGNLRLAYKRVVQNGGAPGVDGVTVAELQAYLKIHWDTVKARLLTGTYRPAPVKRVEIPKPGGGIRLLGIPTVMDRLLQQALLQVIDPNFDTEFSPHSHGFRPGKRAHDAVKEAQGYIRSGLRWTVEMDLEKFFNRVNHDMLMARVARKVTDKRILRLIRAYLNAGVIENGRGDTARRPAQSAFGEHLASSSRAGVRANASWSR